MWTAWFRPAAWGETASYKLMLGQCWPGQGHFPQDASIATSGSWFRCVSCFCWYKEGEKYHSVQNSVHVRSQSVCCGISLIPLHPALKSETLHITRESISWYTSAWLMMARQPPTKSRETATHAFHAFSRETCRAVQIFFPWKTCG